MANMMFPEKYTTKELLTLRNIKIKETQQIAETIKLLTRMSETNDNDVEDIIEYLRLKGVSNSHIKGEI